MKAGALKCIPCAHRRPMRLHVPRMRLPMTQQSVRFERYAMNGSLQSASLTVHVCQLHVCVALRQLHALYTLHTTACVYQFACVCVCVSQALAHTRPSREQRMRHCSCPLSRAVSQPPLSSSCGLLHVRVQVYVECVLYCACTLCAKLFNRSRASALCLYNPIATSTTMARNRG